MANIVALIVVSISKKMNQRTSSKSFYAKFYERLQMTNSNGIWIFSILIMLIILIFKESILKE